MSVSRVIALSFLAIMVSFSGYNLSRLVDYAINFEKISNELCENKDSDFTQCNGICYLADQIIEVKTPDAGFTMDYVQLNSDFHFYFFQGIEERTVLDAEVVHSFGLVPEKTFRGYFEQSVPPPSIIV